MSESKGTILHISDIHRTDDEPVSNDEILHSLKADLERMLGGSEVPQPNVVVISGDITQSAEAEQYVEAEGFIRGLLEFLGLTTNELIVVPGNHDIHRPTCETTFQLRQKSPSGIKPHLVFKHHDDYLCVPNQEVYEKRFDNFRKFYSSLYGKPYPIEPEKQYTIQSHSHLGLAFAGFNSCELIDHRRYQGSINIGAIASAADVLATFSGLKIAVWHHDLNWRHEQSADHLNVHSLRQLSERAFHFGLCGHTHRPAKHDAVLMEGIPMPIIASGSLCAGPRQRKESLGRSYQIIEATSSDLRIHVRVKDEKSTPWRAQIFSQPGGGFCPYYDIRLQDRRVQDPSQHSPSLRVGQVKLPSPFTTNSARDTDPKDVLEQYVWTNLAEQLDRDSPPQIILGPRGSGKTALLLSQTFRGRLHSPRYRDQDLGVLDRLGLLCGMNVDEITAFNSKGWMPLDDRKSSFKATLACIAALQFILTLEQAADWASDRNLDVPDGAEISHVLAILWLNRPGVRTFDDLRLQLHAFRNSIAAASRTRDDERRQRMLDDLAGAALFDGWSSLQHAAEEVAKWQAFSKTRWWLLFDEVEYLCEWQQEVVYSCLSQRSPRLGAKLATLPYAHAQALESLTPDLAPIHDFEEVVLQFPSEKRLDTYGEDSVAQEFEDVALAIWESRLRAVGMPKLSLKDAWPIVSYEQMMANQGPPVPSGRDRLEAALIADLAPKARKRALEMQATDRAKFNDQYWRKFAQPFRYRLAAKLKAQGKEIPLVWGWQQMIKACDGNCRWFLQLADECWNRFWTKDGIRPIDPWEQYTALRGLSESVYRVCGRLTEHGPDLKDVINEISRDLIERTILAPSLSEEALTISTKELAESQANAIAVGIAFGYLVPKLEENSLGRPIYPRRETTLRLGFLIALELRIPLRAGATRKIDLRQARFPWLKT